MLYTMLVGKYPFQVSCEADAAAAAATDTAAARSVLVWFMLPARNSSRAALPTPYPALQGGCHIWQRMQEKDLDLESPNLPRECRALLQQMLQPEISARISISGILSHPWFLADLPAGAADMNDRYLSQPQACEQTEADILTIIKQAQGLPA